MKYDEFTSKFFDGKTLENRICCVFDCNNYVGYAKRFYDSWVFHCKNCAKIRGIEKYYRLVEK